MSEPRRTPGPAARPKARGRGGERGEPLSAGGGEPPRALPEVAPPLPDDDATYLRAVEARFVALRGKGYALSARDVGRVLGWRSDGVPLRVALGVIEDAVAKQRADGARDEVQRVTLGRFERSVQAATRRWSERAAKTTEVEAKAPEGAWARLRAAIEEAGRAAGPARQALRDAWRALGERESAAADPWEAALAIDKKLCDSLAALVPEAERGELEQAIERGLDARMSPSARREQAEFERARALRRRFEVPELLEVLIHG